ncbi:MAG: recombination regulator RecX [Pelistega sp.]|nr:recombination regulator RecX [Pelistega sp.]
MSNYDDEFNSPPRRNKFDPITGKALPSNSHDAAVDNTAITRSSESFSRTPKQSAARNKSCFKTGTATHTSQSSSPVATPASVSESLYSRSSERIKHVKSNKQFRTSNTAVRAQINADSSLIDTPLIDSSLVDITLVDSALVNNSLVDTSFVDASLVDRSLVKRSLAGSTNKELSNLQSRTPGRQTKTLLMRGIDYLSRREHSAYELRRKLAPYAESEEELEATMQRLQKENWQNDERFMRNFSQAKQARWGSAKVLHALASHKLEAENLEALREQLRDTEYDRALEVYQRKFRTALNEAADFQREYARRVRFMMSRGFNAEVVRKVLKAPAQDKD